LGVAVGFADLRQGSYCATRPLRMLRIRTDPRVWTTRPPRGDFYAARIHAWVRFLLPKTNLAMNAKHMCQESA